MKYEVFETNSGCLILVVSGDDGRACYVHSCYESVPGQLTRDIGLLRSGANPILDGWDNNELGEFGENFISALRLGCCLIVDNDGYYFERMGNAGYFEFGGDLL